MGRHVVVFGAGLAFVREHWEGDGLSSMFGVSFYAIDGERIVATCFGDKTYKFTSVIDPK